MNARHDFTPCFEQRQTGEAGSVRVGAGSRTGRLRSALVTGSTLAALWAGFHWADPASWAIGVPTVLLGAAVAFALPSGTPPRVSLRGAAGLAAFALRGIALGAVDVTRRSLRPDTLDAGCMVWKTTLPEGRPRRVFAIAITLLPGTLTARLDGDTLLVHALDPGHATRADLGRLETRVARLFNLPDTEARA